MRKSIVAVLALAAFLAVGVLAPSVGAQSGAGGAEGGDPSDTAIKRDTSATLVYFQGPNPFNPYYSTVSAFAGDVKSKGRCKKRRTVRVGPALGLTVRSDKQGEFLVVTTD